MMLGLAMAASASAALPSEAHAGGRRHEGLCDWGEYGKGPHFNHRGHGGDFGPPFFTHGPGCGIPFIPPQRPLHPSGSIGSDAGRFGSSDFGPYSGAPPFPDVVDPRRGAGPGGAAWPTR